MHPRGAFLCNGNEVSYYIKNTRRVFALNNESICPPGDFLRHSVSYLILVKHLGMILLLNLNISQKLS